MANVPDYRTARHPVNNIYFRIIHVIPKDRNPNQTTKQEIHVFSGSDPSLKIENSITLIRELQIENLLSYLTKNPWQFKYPRQPAKQEALKALQRAKKWQNMLVLGEAKTHQEIADIEGYARDRVTRILGLLRLSPDIQKKIFAMPQVKHIKVRDLTALSRIQDIKKQNELFSRLASGRPINN